VTTGPLASLALVAGARADSARAWLGEPPRPEVPPPAPAAGATGGRLLLIVAAASVLAAVDLDLKATVATPPWAYHYRPGSWVVLCVLVLVGALALARVPSRAVALSAGIVSGGVLGNLLSARVNADYVPNPLVVGSFARGVAFNLADVFTLVGVAALTGSLLVTTFRYRDRLRLGRRVPAPPSVDASAGPRRL
jgi:hypothetical protein